MPKFAIEDVNIIQILETGFVGFSVILMFFAFMLLRNLVQANDRPVEVLRTQTNAVTKYLYLAAGVMFAGLLTSASSSILPTFFPAPVDKVTVMLDTQPTNFIHSDKLRVKVAGKYLTWEKEDIGNGAIRTYIENAVITADHDVDIDFVGIVRLIEGLENEIQIQNQAALALQARLTAGANAETEGGI
jgi:hypothetical protein